MWRRRRIVLIAPSRALPVPLTLTRSVAVAEAVAVSIALPVALALAVAFADAGPARVIDERCDVRGGRPNAAADGQRNLLHR